MQRNDTALNKQKEQNELKTNRTIAHLGFLPTHKKATPKNQKSYFFPPLKKKLSTF